MTLCWLGLHRWLYYGQFDTRRHCVRCMKRQNLHLSEWGLKWWL